MKLPFRRSLAVALAALAVALAAGSIAVPTATACHQDLGTRWCGKLYGAAQTGSYGRGRSPHARTAAQTMQPLEIVRRGGFDWGDAGIGAAFGAGIVVLCRVPLLVVSRRRRRVQAT